MRTATREGVAFVVTCEHGGNRIPPAYRSLFRGRRRLLASHRGYDRGALRVAQDLARALDAPLVGSTVSRLLVELNRSPHHPALYSRIMRSASVATREHVRRRYYAPYRAAVEHAVRAALARGRFVVHVSSHTFAPRRNGEIRRTDVGLLYDPRRPRERRLCLRWQAALRALAPRWRVRRNHPYRGTSDGMTRQLRRQFGAAYAGIELEINQKHVRASAGVWRACRRRVVAALQTALAGGV